MIKDSYLVEKRNILNELRSGGMTLQELRFFSIYLAKINARDPATRVVRIPMADYQRIMELGRLNLTYLKTIVSSMLRKLVNVPLENGGFKMFQLFKEGICTQDEYGDWYVEIDAHDQALPLMFEFKEKYFTYQLWNAMRLKSSNQLRMYEILKQYEHAGERVITVVELKELLGIDPEEYPRFGDFKVSVLDVCQKALEEYTDIKYTFEPAGKRGKGGKILQLKFTITKNTSYRTPVTISELLAGTITDSKDECLYTENGPLINVTGEYDPDNGNNYFNRELYPFFTDAFGGEFGREEVKVLYNLAVRINPYRLSGSGSPEIFKRRVYDYFKLKHDELRWRAGRNDLEPLKNRFSYLKKIIEAELPEE